MEPLIRHHALTVWQLKHKYSTPYLGTKYLHPDSGLFFEFRMAACSDVSPSSTLVWPSNPDRKSTVVVNEAEE
jgi:hypothetical protein